MKPLNAILRRRLHIALWTAVALIFFAGFITGRATATDDDVPPIYNPPKESPAVVKTTAPVTPKFTAKPEWLTVTTTGYCGCKKCCGKWVDKRSDGIIRTASGAEAVAGMTVAADWDVFPKGTVIEIEGAGRYTVQDKPADWVIERYSGMIIDVYYSSHAEALAHGRQEARVRVIRKGE